MAERKTASQPGERVLFETRPRFTLNLGSTFIKIIVLLLLLYFFPTILALTATIQDFLINYVRIPLVQGVSYLLLLLVVILFLWILWEIASWRAVHYILTNRRVMIHKGIIRKKKIYIPYNKIQDINISQGLLERAFRSGDIEIFAGHEHTNMILEDVPNPSQVDNTINRLMQGEETGFREYKRTEDPKSVIDEYDKKFKF
jgi:membrane protein YdbS with pleckstrin-like domain